jgi:hypothetical protein
MKRFVRIGMQIVDWVYETEREALEELIEDLEFSLEQAQKRIVEVEEVEG